MYLSQLLPDPRSRLVLRDLANPYQLHRTLMSAFPAPMPPEERVLFRLDQQRSQPGLSILVQSAAWPDWNGLSSSNYLLQPAAVKEFSCEAATGQVFRFRLLANPTKRLKGDGQTDGPRVGLQREEDQLAWLNRKAGLNGFLVLEVQTVKVTQPDGWKEARNKNQLIRCQAVRFDGRLQVNDPAAFQAALAAGIGSGKGFGFGLLSLAPAS